MQETLVQSLGWEDPLEKGKAPVFWPGEFHGLYHPWGHRVGHDGVTFTFSTLERIILHSQVEFILGIQGRFII